MRRSKKEGQMPIELINIINEITVTGPEEELARFRREHVLRTADGMDWLDFRRVVPIPDAVLETPWSEELELGYTAWYGPEMSNDVCVTSVREIIALPWIVDAGVRSRPQLCAYLEAKGPDYKLQADIGRRNMAAVGFTQGRTAATVLWGTHRNAYDFEWLSQDAGELVFRFVTAWSSPDPIFAQLRRCFPTLSFHVESWDPTGTYYDDEDSSEGHTDE
jgi:hypothetical protein